ncbi:MAG: hypothetical protein NVS3B14_07860 [Ktedonobacteraceae bacterium]
MERVLIVAKTHMKNNACVGGLTRDTNKSIRLLCPDGSNQAANTLYDVGQVWELDFHPRVEISPPHVEDVIVTNEKYLGKSSNLLDTLLRRVPIWRGGPTELFEGLLTFENGRGYIDKSKDIPNHSTGYWLSETSLVLIQRYDK